MISQAPSFLPTTALSCIAFDADDTLWDNEPFFRQTEQEFFERLKNYMPVEELSSILFETEMRNMSLYGYGVKAFTLSMLECALQVSQNQISGKEVAQIVELGRAQLEAPVHLLEGVDATLKTLSERYPLIVVTKGDLLDQERKLERSGLAPYFDHIEILSEKQVPQYQKTLHSLKLSPEHFLMVGNSLKSDILPILALGGYAIHIPYSMTWLHERAEAPQNHPRFFTAPHIGEIPSWVAQIEKSVL